MLKRGLLLTPLLVLLAAAAHAEIITFTGGTVYFPGGSTTVTTNNSGYWSGVDYYLEGSMKYDFEGPQGTIGDYYSIGAGGFVGNDVVHAHWGPWLTQMVITKIDGSTFDLNYVDITSNTTNAGSQQSGLELSYIATNTGYSMLLPSSDWGFASDFYGVAGDGVARLFLDSHFDGVTSVTITSANAYCFGMDNFYIDEPPPTVPDGASTLLLLGTALAGIGGVRRRLRS